MTYTNDQLAALHAFQSGINLLLLGDPGTGKSTLIEAMVQYAHANNKKIAVTASTGIAAQRIGGNTIHSFLKAFPGMDYKHVDYPSKVTYLNNTDILIIDEISMLGSFFMEYLYKCLANSLHPVQIVLIGDFFQLPPVKDRYAFTSPYWALLDLHICFLREVVRQNNAEFIKNINFMKYGRTECLNYFSSNSSKYKLKQQISICATRKEANTINNYESSLLNGASMQYHALYEGYISINDAPTELVLSFKCGMRVMSLINGNGYSNGSLGIITGLSTKSIRVLFDNGSEISFVRHSFTVPRIDGIEESTRFIQFPLRPAYAITIHKSQGQTFDKVNINGARCWAPGQLYVAVSRARSIEGIHFLTPVRASNLVTNASVIQFYESMGA